MFEGTSRSPAMGQLADGARVAQGVFARAKVSLWTGRRSVDLMRSCWRPTVFKASPLDTATSGTLQRHSPKGVAPSWD
jgi:hypothetical protein